MKNKRVLSVIIVILVIAALILLFKAVSPLWETAKPVDSGSGQMADDVAQQTGTYTSPIDFAQLKQQNADTIAWITIPDTNVNYPIVQNTEDDTYYLNHDFDGEHSSAGTLFTEHVYNAADFNDPVTVVYGHRMYSGDMLGELQEDYSDADSFAAHQVINVYLPERQLQYTVFAAVPFDNRHILANWDFSNEVDYMNFFREIRQINAVGSNINNDIHFDMQDKILVISTCLWGDKTQRYLVLAKLTDTITENKGKDE